MTTEAAKISDLRGALRRRGIWGSRADRLVRAWADHVQDDVARRVDEGWSHEAAQEAAWRALGTPEVLAVSAARELTGASWLGRHPWLGGLVLPMLAWMAVVTATMAIPWGIVVTIYGPPPLRETPLLTSLFAGYLLVCNWLPWLLSMAWVARLAVRMPGGWKLFWITTIVLTLCATFSQRFMTSGDWGPPVPLPFPSGILGLITMAIVHFLNPEGAAFWASHIHQGPWIQTAVSLLGATVFYRRATALRESRGAALAG